MQQLQTQMFGIPHKTIFS